MIRIIIQIDAGASALGAPALALALLVLALRAAAAVLALVAFLAGLLAAGQRIIGQRVSGQRQGKRHLGFKTGRRTSQLCHFRKEFLIGISAFFRGGRDGVGPSRRVGHPVAVDPDPALAAEAQAHGWPVLSLRD